MANRGSVRKGPPKHTLSEITAKVCSMSTQKIARLTTALLFLAAAGFLGTETARAEEWTKTFNLTGRPSVRIDTNDGAVHVVTGAAFKQVDVRVEYGGVHTQIDVNIA